MADQEPLAEGTPPAETKPKRKWSRKPKTVEVPVEQLNNLMARLANLESQVAAAPTTVAAEIEITPDTKTDTPLVPGQYVNVGTEHAPDYRKVRWTRAWVEKVYPPVTFRPEESMVVGPHGIFWELFRRQEITVPSIVRELHDAEIKRREDMYKPYRPLNILEHSDLASRALENPGTPIWSRLHSAGQGLVVRGNEDAAPEPANA